MPKNLWILTEERPKRAVIHNILFKFSKDNEIPCFIDTIRLLPLLNKNGDFSFTYDIVGFKSNKINKIFLKTISGQSSFVDFLLFYQDKEPATTDIPLYAIEETKTDDAESRNTGIFQRASKFVYIDFFYTDVKKVMLYSLQIKQKETATRTNIFGTKCLLTLGVEIMGKKLDQTFHTTFKTIDELIDFKNSMRRPPKGNVPIAIKKYDDKIEVSGRLFKSGSLSHDPNIGALSLICASLRKLGWTKRLVITEHGLNQRHIKGNNKFVQIASKLNIEFNGLQNVSPRIKESYWHYEIEGEKLGTIFIHLVVENFTRGSSLFENHAGCEKGYFLTKTGEPIPLEKYQDREKYKNGDKTQVVHIPDLILIDFDRSEIINIEGKKYKFRSDGIEDLKNFDAIEKSYIEPNYPKFKIIRTVVLYGSLEEKIIEIEVGFLLNENGKLILGINAPDLFKDALKNLLDFWNISGRADTQKSDLYFSDIIPDEDMQKTAKYKDYLPVYSLEAVATAFSEEQKLPKVLGWKKMAIKKKLDNDYFIAKVVGHSMEPTIADGSPCLFRFERGGSRDGKIVLVESRKVSDPETHQRYTIKRYSSEKKPIDGERWVHSKITLSPDNKEFKDIILENVLEDDFKIIAEFVQILK